MVETAIFLLETKAFALTRRSTHAAHGAADGPAAETPHNLSNNRSCVLPSRISYNMNYGGLLVNTKLVPKGR